MPEKVVIANSLRRCVREGSHGWSREVARGLCQFNRWYHSIVFEDGVMMPSQEPCVEMEGLLTQQTYSETYNIALQRDGAPPVLSLNLSDPFVILRPPFTS